MLRVQTAGESHGPVLLVIIEGVPAGLEIDAEYINRYLELRQLGYGRGGRMAIEKDQVEILSGVRNRLTMGSPVALSIKNHDYVNWQKYMSAGEITAGREVVRPRPGHADLAGAMKYRHQDFRNVLERASARETAARVAAGSIFRKLLEVLNIRIYSQVLSIGGVVVPRAPLSYSPELQAVIDSSPVGCADQEWARRMMDAISQAREQGESLGGSFEIVVNNVVPGLGSYAHWERRLDARLAAGVMSIPAIKAVEIGDGIHSSLKPGSQVHDEIYYHQEAGLYRKQNHAGGIEGGVSNGEPIVVRGYMKPIPTLYNPLTSVDISEWKEHRAQIERSDICAVPAARVVAEAVVAGVITEEILLKFGGDSMEQLVESYRANLKYLEKVWRWKRTLY